MSRVVGKQAPFWCQQMCPFDYQRESRNGDFGGTFWSWAYRWLSGKESACKAEDSGDPGSIPGSGLFPWRRKWQPTPVFLPGESHGQRSLVGYSPGGCQESDTTEHPLDQTLELDEGEPGLLAKRKCRGTPVTRGRGDPHGRKQEGSANPSQPLPGFASGSRVQQPQ